MNEGFRVTLYGFGRLANIYIVGFDVAMKVTVLDNVFNGMTLRNMKIMHLI
jgi:hypothetical protein